MVDWTLWLVGGAMVGYPIAMVLLSSWVSKWLYQQSKTYWHYALWSVGWTVVCPIVLILLVSTDGLTAYNGVCPGWADSPDRPCSFWQLWEQQLFWATMLCLVPALAGILISTMVLAWQWMRLSRKKALDSRSSSAEEHPKA